MIKSNSPQSYSLADIATRWRCSHSTVLAHVRAGELHAIDISTNPAGRSRYVVSEESLAEFESRRTVKPPAAPAKRRAKIKLRDVIEFIT